jgi:hypothetical protein
MEKLVYLVRTDEPAAVTSRLLDDAAPRILDAGVAGLTIDVVDPSIDLSRSAAAGSDPELCALVSIWTESLDDRRELQGELLVDGARLDGYLVTESVPVPYPDRDWPDGESTPGPVLLTLFTQPDGMSDDDFFACWHGSHTPLSLEIHPLWCYVRNVVVRRLTLGAPPWRGIVKETFRTVEDLTDPMRLFSGDGDTATMKENARRSIEDGARFLDFDGGVQTYALREQIFRSFPPAG